MIWLAKNANDRLSVVQTLRFQIVNKRFACVSVDKKNAIATVPPFWKVFARLSQNYFTSLLKGACMTQDCFMSLLKGVCTAQSKLFYLLSERCLHGSVKKLIYLSSERRLYGSVKILFLTPFWKVFARLSQNCFSSLLKGACTSQSTPFYLPSERCLQGSVRTALPPFWKVFERISQNCFTSLLKGICRSNRK